MSLHEKDHPTIINTSMEHFTMDYIKQGIKNLASGKAHCIDGLEAKFFKWGIETLSPHIILFFNNANQEGFLVE